MPGRGLLSEFFVHRASRLEFLAVALREVLAATQADDPLTPQVVVVAHAGMGRWLRQFLALHQGAQSAPGVVANLELLLPFEWLDRLERDRLGTTASAGWQRETLRWTLDAILHEFEQEPALAALLTGDESARERFRLADRMATLFAQYLLYRRARVAGWDAGREQIWQARLWRTLRRRVRGMHRGDSLTALLATLRGDSARAIECPHLMFGFNHLPPDHLELLHALSARAPVHLFHPNPSLVPWGDLATERAIANSRDAAALHLDSGHPLLAALGGHGQTLVAALEALDDAPGFGEPLDGREPAQTHRLGVLQQSLRELDAEASLRSDHCPAAQHDASLRVHVCHTRLREVEALRDAILSRMLEEPELAPRDIVVMAPDVEAYAQLLPAVFGDPMFAPWLPYQCADRALGALHPLFARMQRLLAIDRVRFGVDDLLDLLAIPAVSRRFGADAAVLATIAQWAREAGVVWGLDARDRTGVEASDESTLHTWQFAVDRVTAGHLGGDSEALCDGVLPLADAGSSSGAALAVLAESTRRLTDWRDALGGRRTVAGWVEAVQQLLDGLFAPAPTDFDASDALAHFKATLLAVEEQAQSADRLDRVPFGSVREALRGKLDGGSANAAQPFLGGGITVCGMVPARALPFSMVCVLGLNDGEFPRIDRGQGLDLMQGPGAWQRGDRNQRDEDRYLFLEAVQSARTTLHLSYRGLDARSGEPMAPAAPLAELMAWLDGAHARGMGPHSGNVEGAEVADKPQRLGATRPWLIEHALQPFAPRAFDGCVPALASFDTRLYNVAVAARAGAQTLAPFLDAPSPRASDESPLPLRGIVAWLRDPGRAFVRDTLGIEQPWFGLAEDFDEPLDARLPKASAQALSAALVASFWRTGDLPVTLPDALRKSGLMPPGAAADAAFATTRDQIEKVARDLAGARLAQLFGSTAAPIDIELVLSDQALTLNGRVEDFVAPATTLRRVRFRGAPRIGDALSALFEWAVLRIAHAPATSLLLWPPFKLADEIEIGAWLEPAHASMEKLHAFVAAVCERYREAQARPMLLPPRTTTALLGASTPQSPAIDKALLAWRGKGLVKGESDYTQWALLARGAPLLDADDQFSEGVIEDAAWARSILRALLVQSS